MKKILYVLLLGLLFTSVKAKTSFDFTFPEIKGNVKLNSSDLYSKNSNSFYKNANIKTPIISDKANIIDPQLKDLFVFEFLSEPNRVYHFKSK